MKRRRDGFWNNSPVDITSERSARLAGTELAQWRFMLRMPSPSTDEVADSLSLSPSPPVHVRNVAFTLLAVGIVVLLLQFMQPVLIPFVFGGLLFYALDPAVDWLQQKHVPRAVGAALMLSLVVSGCGVLAYSLQGQALTVINQLPEGARRVAASVRKASGATPTAMEKVQQAADALKVRRIVAAKPRRRSSSGPGSRVSGERVRLDELHRSDVGGQSACHGAVSHLLHAVVGLALQAKTRGNCRDILAKEGHGHRPRGYCGTDSTVSRDTDS